MKKTLISALVAVGMFTMPVAAFAATSVDCHVTPNASQCQGGGNPEILMSPWGRNQDVPHIQPGQKAADGISLCPIWFTNYCVDISAYRATLR